MSRVLFHRDFRRLTGGHLKVWHYFRHLADSGRFEPVVHFSPQSLMGAGNPWRGVQAHIVPAWEPARADVIFFAGLDWQLCADREPAPDQPVVNLIQHVRHGEPRDPRHAYLARRAVRICVSPEVEAALRTSGRVNGPVVTIPNGIDLAPESGRGTTKSVDLFIAGLKNRPDALYLARRFTQAGYCVDAAAALLPRDEFLRRMGEARHAVLLPNRTEGFYLPALEAMALGCCVVCPDCVGNRSFCRDGENCLRPAYDRAGLAAAVEKALTMTPAERERLLAGARRTVAHHSLERERDAFLQLMDQLPSLWRSHEE